MGVYNPLLYVFNPVYMFHFHVGYVDKDVAKR